MPLRLEKASIVLALVGMPGSGKSTVGRQLARKLGVGFVDTDQVIELRIGCSIRDFFEREGEAAFRDIEAQVLDDMTQTPCGVMATGGGAVLREANRVCLASHDDSIINYCKQEIKTAAVPKERYEFQMLYGMRAKTWEAIANEGHNMAVYLPYGEHWQAYYSRRLAERKENIFFVLKNLFRD